MVKAKEFKTIKQRAKEIVERSDLKMVDVYNRRLRDDLTDKQVIDGIRVLAHFISIPERVLNEEETAMFNHMLFEKIKVS